jgi:hypothetical protein
MREGKFQSTQKLPVDLGIHSLIRPFGAPSPKGKESNYTFNNRNSRSHELITRKKVSYSLRFTEI